MISYEEVIADKKFLSEHEKYSSIKEGDWAYHDLNHIFNVVGFAEKAARLFGFDSTQINEIKIAAAIHDIGVSNIGKDGHAFRSYKWAEKFLVDKEIGNKEEILDAIKNHGDGSGGVYCKIITLGDKLDICRDRITALGKTIIGNRQLCHFISVDFEIEEGIFTVRFISDGKIDMAELNEYYFVPKVFSAVKGIAEHFGREYKVFIDSTEWKFLKR